MTSTRRVTSADVAREAGLSRATVSYVLNNTPRQTIPETTRRRVLDAAERLGYRPFGPARLLRGGKSRVVLLLTPTLPTAADRIASSIVSALADELRNAELRLVWQLGGDDLSAVSADLAPAVVLISTASDDPESAAVRNAFDAPVLEVFPGLNRFLASPGAAQVEYLVDRGHRCLAYAAPADPGLAAASDLRRRAVEQAADRLALPAPRSFSFELDRVRAQEQLSRLRRSSPRPTAVCAYNDAVAFAVLAAAADAGLRVPEDLAVIGVDADPLGALVTPALTSVMADLTAFVRDLAASIALVAAGESPQPVALPERMIALVRASA